ncbi:protein Hook homolog 3-like [Periplaneta americana]|uniref:protein Hook homolog 3-like n=1 Tax=Periplaneta americana TaxID=6978 RepID=UPI0037E85319
MSTSLLKEPEAPCLTKGCGDNSRNQLGAEQGALRFKRSNKIPSFLPCRRPGFKRTPKTEIISATYLHTTSGGDTLKKYKKASSLGDLIPNLGEENKEKRKHRQYMTSPSILITAAELPVQRPMPNTLAARRVCQILVLNAWRRRRHDVLQLTVTCQQLRTQVDNLNIQTVVLRTLLEYEKGRVSNINSNMQKMAARVEEVHREKDTLKTENEGLKKEIELIEIQIAEFQTRSNNLKNDFLSAQNTVDALENQMTKERDKSAKLREDKKYLLNKVHTTEELVKLKDLTIDSLEATRKELESQLIEQVQKCSTAEMENITTKKNVQCLQEEQNKLAAEQKTMEDTISQLKTKIEGLESHLKDKSKENLELEKTINKQLAEIRELENKILENAQMQSSWSSRALQMAASFANIPRAIFHMLLPQNHH